MFNYKNEIEDWLDAMRIENYTINEDLTVDVAGNVDLVRSWLKELPVQFGKVEGFFDCSHNQLTTLEGSPKEISDYFDCSHNQLISLKGCPNEVKGTFDCSNNQLITLEYGPRTVECGCFCENNQLTSLEFSPNEIRGESFDCSGNKITSLEHLPKSLSANIYFNCNDNNLDNEVLYSMNPDQIKHYYVSKKLSERFQRELPQVKQDKPVRKMKL